MNSNTPKRASSRLRNLRRSSNSHSRVASCGSDCGSGPRCAWRGSSSGNVPASSRVGKLCGLRCLAAAIVGQGQQPDHAPASLACPRAARRYPVTPGPTTRPCAGKPRAHQGHRAAHRRCVATWSTTPSHPCPAPQADGPAPLRLPRSTVPSRCLLPHGARRYGRDRSAWSAVGGAEQQLEPIIVEVDAQGVADQPRRQRVEHLAQGEA